MQINLK